MPRVFIYLSIFCLLIQEVKLLGQSQTPLLNNQLQLDNVVSPHPNAAEAIAHMLSYYQAPAVPQGKVSYWNGQEAIQLDYGQQTWDFQQLLNSPDALSSWIEQLDVGLRTWQSNQVRQTNWTAFSRFLSENLNYTVQEEQVNGNLFEQATLVQSYLQQGQPILARLHSQINNAYHYVVIDGFRIRSGQAEMHIIGCNPDFETNWYADTDTYPLDQFPDMDHFLVITPNLTTPTGFQATELDQSFVTLEWNSKDSTAYQLIRYEEDNPTQTGLLLSWEPSFDYFDYNIEPGKSYLYELRAAADGSGRQAGPGAVLKVEIPDITCPDSIWLVDRIENLALLEWEGDFSQDYQVVELKKEDTLLLSPWVSNQSYLLEDIVNHENSLIGIKTRHFFYPGSRLCPQQVLIPKQQVVYNDLFTASKGVFSDQVILQWDPSLGRVNLQKYEQGFWIDLPLQAQAQTLDTMIASNDNQLYRLQQLDAATNDIITLAMDVGYTEEKLDLPVSLTFELSTQPGKRLVDLSWSFEADSVRILRTLASFPNQLLPATNWMVNEQRYSDVAVQYNKAYLYALEFKKGELKSLPTELHGATVSALHRLSNLNSKLLDCGATLFFSANENQVSGLRGLKKPLNQTDLIFEISEELKTREYWEIHIQSNDLPFDVFFVKERAGIFEMVEHYQSFNSGDIFLTRLPEDFDFMLLESQINSALFNITSKCEGGILNPDLCSLGTRYDPINSIQTNAKGVAIEDNYVCAEADYMGKELYFKYEADPFFKDDTLDIYLTVRSELVDQIQAFISQDCSPFSACNLIATKVYEKGSDRLVHQQFIWDADQPVQIAVDSKLDTTFVFDLAIETGVLDTTPSYWSDLSVITDCQTEDSYQLQLLMTDSTKIIELQNSNVEVEQTGFNTFLFTEVATDQPLVINYIVNKDSGERWPGTFVYQRVDCGCNTRPKVSLNKPSNYCLDDTEINFFTNLGPNEQAFWSVDFSFFTTVFEDENLTKGQGVDYYLQVRDSISGCTSFRQSLSEHKLNPDFQIFSTITDDACQLPGQIALSTQESYYYNWAHDSTLTGLVANNLQAGSYNLILTDANECSETITFDIVNQDPILIDSMNITPANCLGQNGSIELKINEEYATDWFINHEAVSTLVDLSSSVNEILVFNKQGCILDTSLFVPHIRPFAVDSISVEATTCGEANGVIQLHLPAALDLKIDWLDYTGLDWKNRQGLAAGLYSVAISSSETCQQVYELEIESSETPKSDIQLSATPFSCSEAGVFLQANSEDKLYWDVSGIPAQNYIGFPTGNQVLVSESPQNCEEKFDVFIPDVTSGTRFFTKIVQDTCNQGEGLVLPNYFTITNQPVQLTINQLVDAPNANLKKGSYFFEFTNEIGCPVRDTFKLNNKVPFETLIDIQGELCGLPNTFIEVNVENEDISNYRLDWIGEQKNNTQLLVQRNGQHNFLISNESGCTDSIYFEVNAKPELSLDLRTFVQPNCQLANGSIAPNISGGTQPYKYSWSDGDTLASRNSLAPGKYLITISDANGCMAQDSLEFFNRDLYDIEAVIDSPLCYNEASGTIQLQLVSDKPYGNVTYTWRDSISGSQRIGLSSGTYFVQANADGCLVDRQFSLYDPPPFLVERFAAIEACEEQQFRVLPQVQGGILPYRYFLNGQYFEEDTLLLANPELEDLFLEVEDANRCLEEQVIPLQVFTKPPLIQSPDTIFVEGEEIELSTASFPEIRWVGLPFEACENCSSTSFIAAENLIAGLEVTDFNNCFWADYLNLTVVKRSLDIIPPVNVITPNGDGVHDFLVFDKIARFPNNQLSVFTKWGNLIYSERNYQNNWNGIDENGQLLPAGEYYYILQVNEEMIKSFLQIVRE